MRSSCRAAASLLMLLGASAGCDLASGGGEREAPAPPPAASSSRPASSPPAVLDSALAAGPIDERAARDTLLLYLRLLHERRFAEGAPFLDPSAYRFRALPTEMAGALRETTCGGIADDALEAVERDSLGPVAIAQYVRCACDVGRFHCAFGAAEVVDASTAGELATFTVRFRDAQGELLAISYDCGSEDCTEEDTAPHSAFTFKVRRAGRRYYVDELPPQYN